jgi:DNA-binding NarL/FixJ family response regulator
VTDLRLPGLDRAELIKTLRRQGPEIRAVIISACSDEGTLRAAREAGVAESSRSR